MSKRLKSGSVPYLSARETKSGKVWRFIPSPKLRKAHGYGAFSYYCDGPPVPLTEWAERGFSIEAVNALHLYKITLPGKAMTHGQAVDLANVIADYVTSHLPKAKARPAGGRARDIARLLDDFTSHKSRFVRAHGDVRSKGTISPRTLEGIVTNARFIRRLMGDLAPAALDEDAIRDWFEDERAERGHRAAYYSYQVLRQSFLWARGNRDWKPFMPDIYWPSCNIPEPEKRQTVITMTEYAALVLAAERPDLFDCTHEKHAFANQPLFVVADALLLAVGTMARPYDTIHARFSNIDGDKLRYRALKTARAGTVALLPSTLARLDLIRARAKAKGWAHSDYILRDDREGRPIADYHRGGDSHMSRLFAHVRSRAATLEPGLKDKRFKDLRRTSFNAGRGSGIDPEDLARWTTHSLRSLPQIADTYAPGTDRESERVRDLILADPNGGVNALLAAARGDARGDGSAE